ncbi:YaaL family protein [Niallia sp. Krafla_26]|uniref:YaaL family protein n=1 Tax=Niallia sp. Krafla_26 TaxID=3064703 RepID=UPI003D1724B6
MFFRRKGRLRAEFNERLVEQLSETKKNWDRQKDLFEKSIDPFGEMEIQSEIAKAKYFFLLREAKKRHITLLKSFYD